MKLRDIAYSSYHEQPPEFDSSSPQCHCHSNNSGSVRYKWLCPRILRSGSNSWFAVPGTDLLEKTKKHHQGEAAASPEMHLNAPIPANRRTDSITLPAPASLSVAGAVHHVALFVALGKFLVYLIVSTINNALVCSQERGVQRIKTSPQTGTMAKYSKWI